MLSSIDRDRIEAAVARAESGTTGEIVCVLASEVSHYPEVPIAWGAAIALALPPVALALGLRPLAVAGAAVGAAMKGGRDPTAGIVEAVAICGEALKAHFPGARAGSVSDRPVEV